MIEFTQSTARTACVCVCVCVCVCAHVRACTQAIVTCLLTTFVAAKTSGIKTVKPLNLDSDARGRAASLFDQI